MPEWLLKIHFYFTFISVNLIFFPQFFLGALGMPRRYVDYPDTIIFWNGVSRLGSLLSLVAVIIYIVGLFYMFRESRGVVFNSKVVSSIEWGVSTRRGHHTNLEGVVLYKWLISLKRMNNFQLLGVYSQLIDKKIWFSKINQ